MQSEVLMQQCFISPMDLKRSLWFSLSGTEAVCQMPDGSSV